MWTHALLLVHLSAMYVCGGFPIQYVGANLLHKSATYVNYDECDVSRNDYLHFPRLCQVFIYGTRMIIIWL